MTETNSRTSKSTVLGMALALCSMQSMYAQTDHATLEVGVEAGPAIFIGAGSRGWFGGFLFTGQPHLAYFVTGRYSIGVTGVFCRSVEGEERHLFFGAAYCHVSYFFSSTSRLSPYVGARLGVFFNPDAGALFGLGPQIGLKFFLARQLSINVQLDGAIHPASEGTLLLSSVVLGLSCHI